MRARVFALVIAAVLLAGACSGPEAPLAVRVKELPSDVVLKTAERHEPKAAAVPPLALPLTVPGLTALSDGFDDIAAPPAPRPPSKPHVECPDADPRQAPARVAVNSPRLPPAPGTYSFRNQGSFEVTGANAKKGVFPSYGTREVRGVIDLSTGDQKTYGFEVVSVLGSLATTVGYTLVTEHESPTATRAGLYLTRMRSQAADGSVFQFNPRPSGLLLLPFPAVPGETWSAAGVDPVNQTALSYTGTVGQKTRVDACGTMLDAISVQLDGTVGAEDSPAPGVSEPGPGVGASPSGRDEFRAVYEFGTQYGALSLKDKVTLRRTSPSGALSQVNAAVIDSEPAPPVAPPPGEGG